MKKLMSVLAALILSLTITAAAFAGPFLVCDQTMEDVTAYEIDVNGIVESATLEQLNGQVRIHHDLAGWSDGSYAVRARAGNMWGWSNWCDPLDFAKAVPTDASTAGLGIEE